MINCTMKNFVLALAITFSVSMISCTNNVEQAVGTKGTDAVVEEVVDSAAAVVDSTAAVVDSAAVEASSDTIILH